MKHILAAAILATSCAAHAQTVLDYPCLAKEWGSTGSESKTGVIDGYGWRGWTCMVNGAPKVFGYVWVVGYVPRVPDTAGMTTPNQVARAALALNINPTDNRPGFVTARLVMRQAFEP